MHVALDTRNVFQNGGTGIATYTRTLAETCKQAGFRVSLLKASSLTGNKLQRFGRSFWSHRQVETIASDYAANDLYRTAVCRYQTFSRMTVLKSDAPPEIMHWTSPLPLHWKGSRNIVTIHDLIPILHPELSVTAYKDAKKFFQDCCDNAQAIVTVSNAVRDDILKHLDVSAQKIVNLSQAVEFDTTMLTSAIPAKALCPKGGFLYFGLLERRKNLSRLIRAHGQSRSKRPLTLIGALGHGSDDIIKEKARHPAPERVHIIPWAHRSSLLQAIQDARAVVFPSLAEGFGLPIIEAMLLATPVMTSRGHATEETAGGAAFLVNPYDTEELANSLKNLDEDDGLIEHLKRLGTERVLSFSMDAYGERLISFYNNIPAT